MTDNAEKEIVINWRGEVERELIITWGTECRIIEARGREGEG